MEDLTLPGLLGLIEEAAQGTPRCLVAIAGPPASGKSTLAETLSDRLGARAEVLPMDGFHLENDALEKMGLLARKGAPETFDAEGFLSLLQKVRASGAVAFPRFDRDADRTVPGAGAIGEDTDIVLVEGNYLLLTTGAWAGLEALFDLTIALEVDRAELQQRLIRRWLDQGLSEQDARARALGNDMVNVDFVTANARKAMVTYRSEFGT